MPAARVCACVFACWLPRVLLSRMPSSVRHQSHNNFRGTRYSGEPDCATPRYSLTVFAVLMGRWGWIEASRQNGWCLKPLPFCEGASDVQEHQCQCFHESAVREGVAQTGAVVQGQAGRCCRRWCAVWSTRGTSPAGRSARPVTRWTSNRVPSRRSPACPWTALGAGLSARDDEIFRSRDHALKVTGRAPKRLPAIAGTVEFRVRRYRDSDGVPRYLPLG